MFSFPMFFDNNCAIDERQQNECLMTLSYSEKYISSAVLKKEPIGTLYEEWKHSIVTSNTVTINEC